MIAKSVYKIPNGKLVKINLEYDTNSKKIIKVSIMGDFFAYPSEAIDILEEELKGNALSKKQIFDKIENVVKKNNFEFIGLTSEGLAESIMRCLN